MAVAAGAIPPGTKITQIAAGGSHSLALSSTGQLYAWGQNSDGQLGNGTTTSSSVPVAVAAGAIPPGTKITQIAAGGDHSLALSSTGQLYAWGDNTFGELGNGTTASSSVPVAVAPGANPLGTKITEIAAGGIHSLALSSAGQLYAWGLNGDGQLGDGTTTNSSVPVAVASGAIPPGTTFTQIVAGAMQSMALSSAGEVYAWGQNGDGQLGDGTTTNSPMPVAVALPAGTTIDTLARGSSANHALALIGDLSLTTSSLPAGTVGRSYVAALTGAGGAMPYHFSAKGLPPGVSLDPTSGSINGTPRAAGSYTLSAKLTDADALTGARSITLTVEPTLPARQCADGQTHAPPNCQTPPVLKHLTQSHRTWREPHSRPHRAPLGTTFSFTLNQTATVSFLFTRPSPGRQHKHKCVAATPHNRQRPACTRTATHGRLSLAAHAGQNKLHFQGQTAHHNKLKPGKYTLTIIATNPAHQHSDKQALTFTIVK